MSLVLGLVVLTNESSPAAAQPTVAEAIGGEVEVLADGDVRTALDVVKMMALTDRTSVGDLGASELHMNGE